MTFTHRIALAAVGIGGCLASLPADAHHSWFAVTDTDHPVLTRMTLTKIDWINPHTWLHFNLAGANGATVQVSLENEGIGGLRRAGFNTADDFALGQAYDVTYYPNRDGSPGGFIARIVNVANGRFYEEQAPGQPAGGRGGVIK